MSPHGSPFVPTSIDLTMPPKPLPAQQGAHPRQTHHPPGIPPSQPQRSATRPLHLEIDKLRGMVESVSSCRLPAGSLFEAESSFAPWLGILTQFLPTQSLPTNSTRTFNCPASKSSNTSGIYHITQKAPYSVINNAIISWENVNKVCDQIYLALENSKRILELELRQQQIAQAEAAATAGPASTPAMAAPAAIPALGVMSMDLDAGEAEQDEAEGAPEPVDAEEAAQWQRERIAKLTGAALGIVNWDGEGGGTGSGQGGELLF
ncbi:hypothetical protein BC938DRAFT_479320 [Jimgerdemannia flammicorona]|uniref:Uncharacterized protein n=1 Tax=Jimgerdemannia flammicorona TaxID=994334 RepID=A0A433QY86_9FUNG|nr:hypothetical protein BC938DRAFT_479320 [Jimgerdemannia flammicorona]